MTGSTITYYSCSLAPPIGHFSNVRRKRRFDALAFFRIGFFRTHVMDRRAWFCAFEMKIADGTAAVLTRGVGESFKAIIV